MSNWCATNFILKGNKTDIDCFCKTVNDCRNKPDIAVNDWGKLWLGNLCVAFGYTYDPNNIELRGTIDTNPEAVACFFLQENETDTLEALECNDGTWAVYFSTITAWTRSKWFHKMLEEKFPNVTVAFKSTDEFGNFFNCHLPQMFNLPKYVLQFTDKEDVEAKEGEEKKIATALYEYTGLSFTEDDIKAMDDNFYKTLQDYNDANENHEVYIYQWKEI